MVIYQNSLDYSVKFIPTFYLLAYKCVSHENFIAKAFNKLGGSESTGKEKKKCYYQQLNLEIGQSAHFSSQSIHLNEYIYIYTLCISNWIYSVFPHFITHIYNLPRNK